MLHWLTAYDPTLRHSPLDQPSKWTNSHNRFYLWTLAIILFFAVLIFTVYYVFNAIHQTTLTFFVSAHHALGMFSLSLVVQFICDHVVLQKSRPAALQGIVQLTHAAPNTPINTRQLHHYIQLHTWKYPLFIVAFRLVVVLIGGYVVTDFLSELQLVALLGGAVLAVPFVLEPLLRHRTTTALVLAHTTDTQAPHLLQLMETWLWALYFIIGFLMSYTVIGYGEQLTSRYATLNDALLTGGMALASIVFLWGYSSWLTRRLLHQSEQNSAQPNAAEIQQLAADHALQTPSYTLSPRKALFFPWRGMLQMLYDTDNPVFLLDQRQSATLRTPQAFWRWTRRIIRHGVLAGLLVVAALAILTLGNYAYTQGNYLNQTYWLYDYYLSILIPSSLFLGALGVLVNLLIDFRCILAGVHSINQDILNGRWDLLQLTTLTPQQIVSAKYRLTQLRAWRFVVLSVTLRVMSVLAFLALSIPARPYSNVHAIQSLIEAFLERPIPTFFLGALIVTFVVGFFLEPFWRHQAMAALAISVSAGKSTTNAILTGLACIFAVCFSQAVVGFFIAVALNYTFILYYHLFDYVLRLDYSIYESVFSALMFITGLAVMYIVFVYYVRLKQWMLNRTIRQLFSG